MALPRGNRQQAVIDAGMTELIRPTLYGARHPVHLVSSSCPRAEELRETLVEGPVCESSDTLGVHRLPALRRGDLVAISASGSYGSSLSSRYNGRPRPAEVFIHPGGDLELARARHQVGLRQCRGGSRRAYGSTVGRTTISPTSTESGWAMAKAIVSASADR